MTTTNNAVKSGTWTGGGTFKTEFEPVPASGDVRSIEVVPGTSAATLNFGPTTAESLALYVCYGAVASTDGTNGWDVVQKLGDIAATTDSFVWKYPLGWGKRYAAARFFFIGDAEIPVREYIESTGTQYVFTGLKPKKTMHYEGKVKYLGSNPLTGNQWVTLYGCFVNGDQCLFWYSGSFYYNNPGNYSVSGIGTSDCNFSTTPYDDNASPHTSMTANGVTVSGYNAWGNGPQLKVESMPLFAFDNNGVITTCNSDIRLYNFKAYDNGKLVRDFVPIVYNGEPVLFDRANGDPTNGPIYRRADLGERDFNCSETTVEGETVTLLASSASSILYHDPSMKVKGLILIWR